MLSRLMVDEESRFDRVSASVDDSVWPAPLASIELGHPVASETWGTADEVVAYHCQSSLSGTLRLDGDPGVRVYLHDGLVYFAERTTDPELGFRLVLDGVISEDQLVHGTRLLEGGRHLGRMFANDPSIDRRPVVDAVVGYCADAVASLEGRAVSTYAFQADEHHSSGILAWYSLDDDMDAPSAPVSVPASPASIVAPAARATDVAAAELGVVPAIAAPVAATLSDWLGPLKLEPLVEPDDSVTPVVAESRLPRRSRFDDSERLTTDPGLGAVDISALQAAMTNIRASSATTVTLAARETATPAVRADAPVATAQVPGSPAERRHWVARRHR